MNAEQIKDVLGNAFLSNRDELDFAYLLTDTANGVDSIDLYFAISDSSEIVAKIGNRDGSKMIGIFKTFDELSQAFIQDGLSEEFEIHYTAKSTDANEFMTFLNALDKQIKNKYQNKIVKIDSSGDTCFSVFVN